jgi:hypothetical protein
MRHSSVSERERIERVRKSLADARLVEIELEEFPDRIREVKQIAVGHLGELLQQDAALREHRSVAQSLGTLSRLEATLRADADRHKPEQGDLPAKPKQR